jgi:integrase
MPEKRRPRRSSDATAIEKDGVIERRGRRGTTFSIRYRDANGRLVKERLGTAAEGWTRAKAKTARDKRVSAVRDFGLRMPASSRFRDVIDAWLETLPTSTKIRESTATTYRGNAIHLRRLLGGLRTSRIQPEQVEKYIETRIKEGAAPKTVRNECAALKQVFKFARRRKLLIGDPFLDVELPSAGDPQIVVLRDDELTALGRVIRKFIADAVPGSIDEYWWNLLFDLNVLLLATGLRLSEAIGLNWEYVDLDKGTISVQETLVRGKRERPKSKKSRRLLELAPEALAAVKRRAEVNPPEAGHPVYASPRLGRPIQPGTAREYQRKALKAAGITRKFKPFHDERHTAITAQAAKNVHAFVKSFAGHSQGTITDRYIHEAQIEFPGAAAEGAKRLMDGLHGKDDGAAEDPPSEARGAA